jgi:hypothetical protein
MATSGKKGETIRSEVREVTNSVNCLCKQEAVEEILLTSHAVQGLALSWVHSVFTMKKHQVYKMTELTD